MVSAHEFRGGSWLLKIRCREIEMGKFHSVHCNVSASLILKDIFIYSPSFKSLWGLHHYRILYIHPHFEGVCSVFTELGEV